MFAGWRRWRRTMEDWLKNQSWVRSLAGRGKIWRDAWTRPDTPAAAARSIDRLCAAARLASAPEQVQARQQAIHDRLARFDEAAFDWPALVPDIDERRLDKAALLKPYLGPREKGVLFIAFEREWVKLLRLPDRSAFADRYHLVISPSSSPHNFINYVFPAVYPAPVFTLISNPADVAVLPGVSPHLVVLPLYASHWVNPEWFAPVPRPQRDWDLIMVASWGKVKRHHVLFQALRRMSPRWRILLVGQDQEGRTAQTILEEARWYGVQHRFTLLANQPYAEVAKLFCRARASVVLSRREGSCVVVAESLFADAPVALLAGAEIGSRVFLNDRTGRFLDESDLPRQLEAFLDSADRFQPRAWAEEHIDCFHSSQTLNQLLREHALAQGQNWTMDVAPLMWAPDPCLARPADRARLEPERRDLLLRFGVQVGRDA